MHKLSKEMGKWALEKAKAYGYDNLTHEDWEDLFYCMKAACCGAALDKDYLITEAMEKADEEEKIMEKMGYRYPHMKVNSHGNHMTMGYHYPMFEEDDYIADYLHDPNIFREKMRAGYVDAMHNMDWDNKSQHGVAYDNYRHARRNFTENNTPESAKTLEDMITGVLDDMQMIASDIWKDLTPAQRTKYKPIMENMIKKLPA